MLQAIGPYISRVCLANGAIWSAYQEKKVIRLFLPLLPIGYRDYLHVSHVHKPVYSARHAESHTGRHVNLGTQFWDHSCPPEVGSFSNKTFRRGKVLKTRAPTDNGKCQI